MRNINVLDYSTQEAKVQASPRWSFSQCDPHSRYDRSDQLSVPSYNVQNTQIRKSRYKLGNHVGI